MLLAFLSFIYLFSNSPSKARPLGVRVRERVEAGTKKQSTKTSAFWVLAVVQLPLSPVGLLKAYLTVSIAGSTYLPQDSDHLPFSSGPFLHLEALLDRIHLLCSIQVAIAKYHRLGGL